MPVNYRPQVTIDRPDARAPVTRRTLLVRWQPRIPVIRTFMWGAFTRPVRIRCPMAQLFRVAGDGRDLANASPQRLGGRAVRTP